MVTIVGQKEAKFAVRAHFRAGMFTYARTIKEISKGLVLVGSNSKTIGIWSLETFSCLLTIHPEPKIADLMRDPDVSLSFFSRSCIGLVELERAGTFLRVNQETPEGDIFSL